jgi:hypothetical protein
MVTGAQFSTHRGWQCPSLSESFPRIMPLGLGTDSICSALPARKGQLLLDQGSPTQKR